MGQVSIMDVANFLLKLEHMSNKKLQKLCYYSHAWYLALGKGPLINENFEAWVHGPVCDALYREYKRGIKVGSTSNINLSNDIQEHLKIVYSIYGDLSGDELEALTHKEDPWKIARMGLSSDAPSRNIIDNVLIENYYSELLNR